MLIKQYVNTRSKNLTHFEFSRLAPCSVITKLRKMKIVLPSLKADVEKALRSRVVYKITCLRCLAFYFGQTDRHVSFRFKEHMHPSQPIDKHLRECNEKISFDKRTLLKSFNLEALWQRDLKPQKDS